ncbi:hypothetical protein DL767_001695 [Monosporascus sp. MG133]|nr:hypothetical protein DL767_001695 [Monosporascus sp. MG133]
MSTEVPGDCVTAAYAQYGIPMVADSRSEMLGGWFNPSNFEISLELVNQVQELAARKRCAAAQFAISWIKSCEKLPGLQTTLQIPCATTAERVSENDRTVKFTDAELEEIETPDQTRFCW